MKIGDLVKMRKMKAPLTSFGRGVRSLEVGVIIECVAPDARKVPLWGVLWNRGTMERVWESDMELVT